MTEPLLERRNWTGGRMGLDGPAKPVRVEPLKYPEPLPQHEPAPAEPAQPTPEREPEKVPG